MNEQKIIIFEGVDMTGKTNIAQELSKRIGVPYFKNLKEQDVIEKRETRYNYTDSVFYEQTYMLQFLEQTKHSAIFDRCFVSEYAYSRIFERDTQDELIKSFDERYAKLGAKIIITEKSIAALTDPFKDEKYISLDVAEEIMELYREFASNCKCEVLILNTEDEDLNSQVDKIISFIQK